MSAATGGAGPAEGPVILLATCNGAAYLPAQLDSYLHQRCAGWSLIVSDDGSTDGSAALLEQTAVIWQAAGRLHGPRVLQGPQMGIAANFLHLLRHVPQGARHAALSDQDDVWLPDKLDRALALLDRMDEATPVLYVARAMITTAELAPLRPTPRVLRPAGFRNALVQSIGSGNTMVLNRAAIDLVRAAADEAAGTVVHDWWLYQIIAACGGRIVTDEAVVLLYRQHGGNAIGARTGIGARFRQMLHASGRRFAGWNDSNLQALARSRHRFTPEAARVFDAYVAARRGPLLTRLRALRRSGVYRQGRLGTLALYLACLTGSL